MESPLRRASDLLKRLESSQLFQGAVIFIIIVSALAIGAKTYDLPDWSTPLLSILDIGITVFFLIEILIRFAVCDKKLGFFKDGWNIFDTIIVVGSLIPIQNSEVVLVGRLLRVFRVLRLVSVVPQLRSLINALLKAIPRMGHIGLLMFIIFYIYAAVGSLFFSSVNDELWGDVSIAMLTLFRVATFEDWTDVMYETMAVYPLSWVFFITFIFLAAFVFLNMMVGTILEVMTAEQNAEEAERAHQEREEMSQTLRSMQIQLDSISRQLQKE